MRKRKDLLCKATTYTLDRDEEEDEGEAGALVRVAEDADGGLDGEGREDEALENRRGGKQFAGEWWQAEGDR